MNDPIPATAQSFREVLADIEADLDVASRTVDDAISQASELGLTRQLANFGMLSRNLRMCLDFVKGLKS